MASVILFGCGDLTGEGPKIVSEEPEEPAARATPAAEATPLPGRNWSEVADSVFGTPAPQQEQTTAAVASTTIGATIGALAQAAPSRSGPPRDALTAPDPSLAESASLYLRQGSKAVVNWRGWSAESFAEAESRGAPVVLVIGSSWSHDAQMMDAQVFSDQEIADILNGSFVPIRVDADERPDIWARYRLAFEVINKQMARPPLVVFALPDGRPFDIVGTVAARSAGDDLGLMELLGQANDLVRDQRDAVTEQAASVERVLEQLLTEPRAGNAELSASVINTMASELANAAAGNQSDALRAGRVSSFLMHHFKQESIAKSRDAGSELLLSRFRSGQRDHVMGGYFFRIPGSGEIQFGKLLPVQSEMITANARAFAVTNKTLHKEGVTEVLRYCRDWLENAEGGFYACQAPGIEGRLSGDYFTYTREEIEAVADNPKDAAVFAEYLNAKAGEKTNLHVTGRLQQAADAAGASYQEANAALDKVRYKLRDARMAEDQVPMVDKSILAGWNGDMIQAYLDAATLAGDSKAREFALKTADMIIEQMVSSQDGVARVLHRGRATGFGYLEDNVKVAAALMRCYEVSNQQEYLDSARSLMEYVESKFLDPDSGLYVDVVPIDESETRNGLLKLRRLPLEDDISRSANAVAAIVWHKLHGADSEAKFKERSERMVNAAIQRRGLNTEAMTTWGEAALLVQHGSAKW